MDDECIARGIYSFENGDQVAVSPWAAKSKYFQKRFSSFDSHRILQSIAEVIEVQPTGHVKVFFRFEDLTEEFEDGEVRGIDARVVPEAICKVPLLKKGALLKRVIDTCDASCTSVLKVRKDVPMVLEDDEKDPRKIRVKEDGKLKTYQRFQLELIATPAHDDFRANLTKASTSKPLAKKWFQDMQDSMEKLPDANMTPHSMRSRHAPGDAVKVPEHIARTIRSFEENSGPSIKAFFQYLWLFLARKKKDQVRYFM